MIRSFLIITLLFSTADLLSQKKSETVNLVDNSSSKKAVGALKDTLDQQHLHQKLEFPASQKVSPEIFYIINDKPVSREEFLRIQKEKQ